MPRGDGCAIDPSLRLVGNTSLLATGPPLLGPAALRMALRGRA